MNEAGGRTPATEFFFAPFTHSEITSASCVQTMVLVQGIISGHPGRLYVTVWLDTYDEFGAVNEMRLAPPMAIPRSWTVSMRVLLLMEPLFPFPVRASQA